MVLVLVLGKGWRLWLPLSSFKKEGSGWRGRYGDLCQVQEAPLSRHAPGAETQCPQLFPGAGTQCPRLLPADTQYPPGAETLCPQQLPGERHHTCGGDSISPIPAGRGIAAGTAPSSLVPGCLCCAHIKKGLIHSCLCSYTV